MTIGVQRGGLSWGKVRGLIVPHVYIQNSLQRSKLDLRANGRPVHRPGLARRFTLTLVSGDSFESSDTMKGSVEEYQWVEVCGVSLVDLLSFVTDELHGNGYIVSSIDTNNLASPGAQRGLSECLSRH